MAQEIGVAYVTLLPSGKGFGKAVEGQVDGALGKSEKKTDGFFTKLGSGLKKTAIGIGIAGAAVAAIAVKGGISRALNIEDAQAKLKGLGHDTKSVETIMKDALASVKGTAFGLDAAATTAAAAVASGIKPGKELEGYLRLTADAATIAGVSMEEMGSIMNKVQAKGKASMEDLNRLTERGIPIMQMLADEYGVTAEEMSKMVSKGEVDSERFRAALEKNLGGAALESGNTTRGAFANMMASLSRLGLVFVGEGLAGAKTFFNEVTVIFDGLGERLGPVVDWVQEKLGGMFEIEGMGERFLAFLDSFNLGEIVPMLMAGRGDVFSFGIRLVDDLIQGMVGAIPALINSAAGLIDTIVEAIQQHAPTILNGAVTLFMGLATGLLTVLPQLVQAASTLIIDLVGMIADLLPDLINAGVTLFLGLVESLAIVLPQLIEKLTQVIPQIIEAVITAIPLIVEALATALPQIIEGAIQLFLGIVLGLAEAIPTIIEAVVELIPTLITALIGMIPVLIEGAVQLLMGLIEAIPIIIPALIEGALGMVTSIIEALVTAIPLLLDAAVQLFTSLIEALPIILPDLLMALIGLVPMITMSILEMVPALLGAAIQLFMALVTAVPMMMQKLGPAIAKVWPAIWDNIKQIPGKMMNAGKDIMTGLIDGVKSMIGNVVQAAKDAGGAMLDGIKGFLGIKSPSRVFRDQVGKMVGLGLLEGIDDAAIRGRIDSSVNHMVSVPTGSSIGSGQSGPSVFHLYDSDGRLWGSLKGLVDSALAPASPGNLMDRFGVRRA